MTTFSQAKPAGTPTWVDLTAADVDAARKFYQAVFGWEYDIGGPEFGGYTTARLGQRMTAGLTGPQPGAPPMPAAWSLYFATDSLEADMARAGALGAIDDSPLGRFAALLDPSGAPFKIVQPPAR